VKNKMLGAGMVAVLLAGAALIVGAQGPPPPGGFRGGRGPGPGGPGGPGQGMFEFGGLMGGFGGKLVTGKPVQANFSITHTETLPGNTITNTTTGAFARGADGSTYRDVKMAAIGPWKASGKAQEFAYIRNVTLGMQYVVNVTKGTYQAFAIREHKPPQGAKPDRPARPTPPNETVTDNPSGSYTDPVTKTVYPADDKLTTRMIPAGAIGNLNAIAIVTERWFSSALDILLEDTHTDPRFGTTTYQLSDIGQSPAASLFVPDPAFTQVKGGGFGKGGRRGKGTPPSPPPAD
jgi:hypothetical protein